jgi:osmotically-inducible protein OsmY
MRRGSVAGASAGIAALAMSIANLVGAAPASCAEVAAAQRAGHVAHAESTADQQISEKIRHAIASDDSLSTSARNVTVATSEGVVTLRGAVPNEQERNALVAKARGVAGVVALDNRLEAVAR